MRPFFQFSDEIQKIMYTANIIEGLNRQYRKVTKNNFMQQNPLFLHLIYVIIIITIYF